MDLRRAKLQYTLEILYVAPQCEIHFGLMLAVQALNLAVDKILRQPSSCREQ